MKHKYLTAVMALAIATPAVLFGFGAIAAPAEYMNGKIETINATTKVIRVSGKDLVGFTAYDVSHLKVGDDVEMTFTVSNNQNRVLAIKHMEDDRYGDGVHTN